LAVFEGSHTSLRQCLRERTADELDAKRDKAAKLNEFFDMPNKVPTRIAALPGDVYFTHYRTIHGVLQNYREDRSICYLRFRVKDEIRERLDVPFVSTWTHSMLKYDGFELFASHSPERDGNAEETTG
jgi:ectoine hydroxylase-related dioxygenase (phytanoyl-CoA dioxygenase family)